MNPTKVGLLIYREQNNIGLRGIKMMANEEKRKRVLTGSQVDEAALLLSKISALTDTLNAASGTERTTAIMEDLVKIRAILSV